MEAEKEAIDAAARQYRIAALNNAVIRAGQDGGLSGDPVDVLAFAEIYFGWLTGRSETEKPLLERVKKDKKS